MAVIDLASWTSWPTLRLPVFELGVKIPVGLDQFVECLLSVLEARNFGFQRSILVKHFSLGELGIGKLVHHIGKFTFERRRIALTRLIALPVAASPLTKSIGYLIHSSTLLVANNM